MKDNLKEYFKKLKILEELKNKIENHELKLEKLKNEEKKNINNINKKLFYLNKISQVQQEKIFYLTDYIHQEIKIIRKELQNLKNEINILKNTFCY